MTTLKPHILIVDDDTRILKLLKKFFHLNNFLVSTAISVDEAKKLIHYFIFDIIILDVMLPGITGIEFARSIKASGTTTAPIIMLTALNEPADRIRGLESGALDYLAKPFEPKELLLRVHNLVDSYSQFKKENSITRFGNNFYNSKTKEFIKNDQNIKLSNSEQILLEALIKNIGDVVTRENLAKDVGDLNLRSIDVQITRIRSKIEDNPKEPKYLQTVRSQGYVLYT